MSSGLPCSEDLAQQLSDPEVRSAYVADQVRIKIALAIRALREQPERQWSQSELGRKTGKPQSAISRLEDPDYGRFSLETLLELAAAFGVPLRVDFPEWEEWFKSMSQMSSSTLHRRSYDARRLVSSVRSNKILQVFVTTPLEKMNPVTGTTEYSRSTTQIIQNSASQRGIAVG